MTREHARYDRTPAVAGPALVLAVLVLLAAPVGGAGTAMQADGAPGRAGPDGPASQGAGATAPMSVPDTATLAVRDVRLFDGQEIRRGVNVVVQDGRIAAVGPDVAIPRGAEVVPGEGRTLLPGLIDAHVHLFPATPDPRRSLRQALVFGVTTELDMTSDPDTVARLREEQRAGEAPSRADMFSPGWAATAPGGHGSGEQYGIEGVPTIRGPEEAASWVEARAEEVADYVKIIYEDGSAFGTSLPTLSPATVERVTEEAHQRDLLAVTHVTTLHGARVAVEAGTDVLAHAWMDSVPEPAFVRKVADRDVAVIPTLSVLESIAGREGGDSIAADPRLEPYLLPGSARNLEQSYAEILGREPTPEAFERALDVVSRLHEAGVPILAGTDASVPGTTHGPILHRELKLLVEVGLTPAEALAAATAATAETFALEDLGRVHEGARADLLLVEGDPTEDVTDIREIVAVWKEGRRVDRDAFRERILEARKERPAPEGSESGLISDFEDTASEAPGAEFGAGWSVSTDRMMGGSSEASMSVVKGGAGGSAAALEVSGTVAGDSPIPWAGVMFQPGEKSREPANLSPFEALSFHAAGDGGAHRVMVFAEELGRRPAIQSFTAGREWTRHVIPFAELGGIDGSGILGIIFTGGGEGPFRFRIDDVRLLREVP